MNQNKSRKAQTYFVKFSAFNHHVLLHSEETDTMKRQEQELLKYCLDKKHTFTLKMLAGTD